MFGLDKHPVSILCHRSEMRERNTMRKIITGLMCFLILISFCGCKSEVNADISVYGNTPIQIIGIAENSFTITPNTLAALPCVSRSVDSRSAKVGTVTATGPLLNTFLAQYGLSQSDFTKIRISAADGYKSILKNELLEGEIILSVASGNDPLDKSYQPLRIIIPEAAASYWTYRVNCIEFVKD